MKLILYRNGRSASEEGLEVTPCPNARWIFGEFRPLTSTPGDSISFLVGGQTVSNTQKKDGARRD